METQDSVRLETTSAEAGLPLDRLLLRRLPDMTRNKIRALMAQDRLRLNGLAPSGPAVALAGGDRIEILAVDRDGPSLMFEDPGFLIFYKPAGIEAAQALRIVAGAHSRFHRRPHHRLVEIPDPRISGAVLCTAQPRVFRQLSAAFSGGGACRRFQVLVQPAPESAGGPLPGASGWSFQVDTRFQGAALISLTPPPARNAGPLAALAAARLTPLRLSRTGPPRLAVHQVQLTFRHPRTGRHLSFKPGLPELFRARIEKMVPLRTLAADLPAEPPHTSGTVAPEGPEPALRSPRIRRLPRRSGRGR